MDRRRENAARDETESRREKDAALRRRTRAELDLREAKAKLDAHENGKVGCESQVFRQKAEVESASCTTLILCANTWSSLYR